MKLIADANIFFSALLRKGATRSLWFHPELELICPEFILREILEHKKEIASKYDGTREEFERLQYLLLKNMKTVPDNKIKPYLPAAATLSKDRDDWTYLACALALNVSIWSNDKEFKKQNRVNIFSTTELMKKVGML